VCRDWWARRQLRQQRSAAARDVVCRRAWCGGAGARAEAGSAAAGQN
jgi:hypothetical protein